MLLNHLEYYKMILDQMDNKPTWREQEKINNVSKWPLLGFLKSISVMKFKCKWKDSMY